MGGTTAKICLIDDFQPQTSRSFEVARIGRFKKGSGLPLRIPVIEMVEIGAGGGSLAHLDALGRIAVGPESAGADPGPACYGRGGTQPAVTDANLAARPLRPGALRRRHDGARQRGGRAALDRAVGQPLGVDSGEAAGGVIEMVDETMANAARIHAIESGKTFAGRTVIAFGGGGPVHACRVAEKIGADRIIVPPGAGVGSAIGFLRAPVGYEVVRSQYARLGQFDGPAADGLLAAMAGGCGGRGGTGPVRRSDPDSADGVHALRRSGARDPGPAVGGRAGQRPRCGPPSTRSTPGSTTARCRGRTWR